MKVLLVLFVVLLFGCVEQNETASTKTEEPVAEPYTHNFEFLENELNRISERDVSLSSEHYERILSDLEALEKDGVNTTKLRETLYQLEVSGQEKHEPEDFQQKNVTEESEETKDCASVPVSFEYPPVNLEKINVMLPIGRMSGSHVTPTDHHYFRGPENIEVYAPADGVVTLLAHMPNAPRDTDYRMVIQHNCDVSSIYIHIDQLSEKLAEKAPELHKHTYPNVDVEGGEVIGYFRGSIDYNVVDENVMLQFISPELYEGEPWKIHVPNTFDYFNEPVRAQLIEKNVRKAQPLHGKIDYDTPGKLAGNWFIEGSGGYSNDLGDYWNTHLTIAYDYIDPERVVLSIPQFDDEESKQFAVKGNAPDPADIGVSELIKYELVSYDYFTDNGEHWDRESPEKVHTEPSDEVMGVVLAEMLENNKLKFEAFPGKTASEVSSFTSEAVVYER